VPTSQAVGIISLVGDDAMGWHDSAKQARSDRDVGDAPRRQQQRDRSAATIGQAMNFRGASAA
jgi:hypothetical protein